MGIHYANKALLADPALDITKPEVLMYRPLSDGRLELVGVEYLIPGPAWSEADPPTILGQELEYREELDLYALHLWVWRNNPNGLYADWNPNLDCAGPGAPHYTEAGNALVTQLLYEKMRDIPALVDKLAQP